MCDGLDHPMFVQTMLTFQCENLFNNVTILKYIEHYYNINYMTLTTYHNIAWLWYNNNYQEQSWKHMKRKVAIVPKAIQSIFDAKLGELILGPLTWLGPSNIALDPGELSKIHGVKTWSWNILKPIESLSCLWRYFLNNGDITTDFCRAFRPGIPRDVAKVDYHLTVEQFTKWFDATVGNRKTTGKAKTRLLQHDSPSQTLWGLEEIWYWS